MSGPVDSGRYEAKIVDVARVCRRAGLPCHAGRVPDWACQIVIDFDRRGVGGVVGALRLAKRSVAERHAMLAEIALRRPSAGIRVQFGVRR